MSSFVTDAKFTNIEFSKTSDLIYIDKTPLLKSLGNGQYRLNINESNILGGNSQIWIQPFDFSRKKNNTKLSSVNVPLYYGDLDGDTTVNAADALRTLRIFKSNDPLNKYKSIENIDRRFLAFPSTKPSNVSGLLPTMFDVLNILKISAGILQPEVYMWKYIYRNINDK